MDRKNYPLDGTTDLIGRPKIAVGYISKETVLTGESKPIIVGVLGSEKDLWKRDRMIRFEINVNTMKSQRFTKRTATGSDNCDLSDTFGRTSNIQ